jgi:tetratricopeptide (TPR) repeat protein
MDKFEKYVNDKDLWNKFKEHFRYKSDFKGISKTKRYEFRQKYYDQYVKFYDAGSGIIGLPPLTWLLKNTNLLIKDCLKDKQLGVGVKSIILFSMTLRKLGKTECALRFALKASSLANDSGLIYERIIADNGCAFLYLQLFELEQGKYIAFQSLSDARREKFTDLEADTLSLVGRIFELDEQLTKAKTYYFKSLQIAESTQDLDRKVAALSDIGRILGMQGDFHESLDYLEKGLAIVDEECIIKYYAILNYQIADIYRSLDDIELAYKHLECCRLEIVALDNYSSLTEFESRIGMLKLHEGLYKEALEYFEAVDSQTKSMKYIRDNRINAVAIAETYMAMGNDHKAKDILIQLLKKVKSQTLSYHNLIGQILEKLSIIYSHLGYPSESNDLMEYSRRFKESQKPGTFGSHQQKLTRQSLYSKLDNNISGIIGKEIKEFEIRGRTIKFNQSGGIVTFVNDEVEIRLTPTESTFLKRLRKDQGSPVNALELAREVEPTANDDSPKDWQKLVKVHIAHLRSKLKDDKGGSIIRTVRYKGWKLADS